MQPPVRHVDHESLRRQVCAVLRESLASAPGRFVALAVGDSTLPLYAGLDPEWPEWDGRVITTVDELVPAPDRPDQRFDARLAEALPPGLRNRLVPLDGVHNAGLDAANDADLDAGHDPEHRAEEVEAEMAAGGLAAVVLGLGPDGHIAFNQPPSDAATRTRVVPLTAGNLARLGDVSPARAALTLGVSTLLGAWAVVLVVDGPRKDTALEHLITGPEDPRWPVTWLRRHPRLTVAVGPAAAAPGNYHGSAFLDHNAG